MTLAQIEQILEQARAMESIKWIYFEGGEPFLYAGVLLKAARTAAELGFRVGIVSNAYWATDVRDALECLRPFQGLIQDLSISSDTYHDDERQHRAQHALVAAAKLDIPVGTITISEPDDESDGASGQLPQGASAVMFRGRATEKLVSQVSSSPWNGFNACPHEELSNPDRVHVDPFGYVHVCQGISIGNVFQLPLKEIFRQYDPAAHPIVGPLEIDGPAELVRRYGVPHADGYADACHLCYEARCSLRWRFPDRLVPDAMYGVPSQ